MGPEGRNRPGLITVAYARDIDALELFEDFLIASVASIIVIRVFLHVAGYPTVGGDALHIAHMLWGGLFMLVAFLLLLGYLGRGTKHLAAVLGGIGFGTFIDELGKFLTHDNDYFFEPTFALIYVIFVLMYVVVHWLHRPAPGGWERLANAWELAREGARGAIEPGERERIRVLLDRTPEYAPARVALEDLLARIEAEPPPRPRLMARIRAGARGAYRTMVRRRWFVPAVVTFFVAHSVVGLARSVFLIREPAGAGGLGFLEWGELMSTAAPAALVLYGVVRIRSSRLEAFHAFYHAVLVLVFVSHFFAFYHNQLVAVVGFFWNLVVLVTLRYAIAQEEGMATPGGEALSPASA